MKMKISIDLSKQNDLTQSDKRTELYVWKNLTHLKEFYSGIVDPFAIDQIAGQIRNGSCANGKWAFRKRAEIGEVLNESCLCNMVEIMLLNDQGVLQTFLEKPVAFS